MQESKLARKAEEATIKSQEVTLKRLEGQVGQISNSMNQIQQQQPGKIPAQAHQPPSHFKQAHAVSIVQGNVSEPKWRSKTVSAIKALQRPIVTAPPIVVGPHLTPPKLDDPGSFVFKIDLGNDDDVSGMLDLGAAVNLMPYAVFEKLGNRELKPTDMKIELADGSISYPRGIVEDVEVTIRGIRVYVDFVVLDVGKGIRSEKGQLVLLGRPFMATTNTRIDVKSGTLSMAGTEGSVTFSVFSEKSESHTPSIKNCSYAKLLDTRVEVEIVQDFLANLQDEEDIMQEFLDNLQDDEDVVHDVVSPLQRDEEFDVPAFGQGGSEKKKKERYKRRTMYGEARVVPQLKKKNEKLHRDLVNVGRTEPSLHAPDLQRLLDEEFWMMSVGSKLFDPAWFD